MCDRAYKKSSSPQEWGDSIISRYVSNDSPCVPSHPYVPPEAFYKCLVIYIIFCMVCYKANNLSPQVHRGEFLWAIQIPSQWMKEAASILSYLSTHINTETVKTDKAMYMLCDCLCYQFANLPILGTLLRGIIFWANEMRILLCHMNHTLKYYHNLFWALWPF